MSNQITLYVQEENYHFDGYVAGVIVDEENNRVALYNQEGILESEHIPMPSDNTKWYDLDSVTIDNNRVEVKAKNFALYKKFFCLNIINVKN